MAKRYKPWLSRGIFFPQNELVVSMLEDDVADHGLRMTTAELDRLCSDEQLQPITYNHYYADKCLQNARQESLPRLPNLHKA
jgi:hypothetical protein